MRYTKWTWFWLGWCCASIITFLQYQQWTALSITLGAIAIFLFAPWNKEKA